jgi:hypothetical protein
MITDIFPIQIVHELFHKIHGAKYLFKMDLKLGYYQKNIREEDIPKTAFCSDEGLYEFQVMPFVLSNALANFQVVMNDLFHMYLWKFVPIFFDDIIVCRKSWNSHLKQIDIVLSYILTNPNATLEKER